MKILITGASGYIGSYLAQSLIKQNHEVWLIDNYYIPSNIVEIEGNIIDNKDIRDNIDISEYDLLIHLAAISGITKCAENEKEAYETNVKGTFNLLKTLQDKVLFASTSACYGICQAPEIDEEHSTMPRNFYGETKLQAENLVKLTDKFIILRFSNIYGRGIFCKRTVIDLFIERALKNLPLEIHGDGKQRRDFVHINDVIRAYNRAIKSNINGIYNIGGNEALSINDIAELVVKNYRKVFGYTLDIKHIPEECGEKWKDFIYSSKLAKDRIRYEPMYSVSDEIRERFNTQKRIRE